MPEQTEKRNPQSGQQQFRCQECGKVLNSSEEMREHSKSHQGQRQHQGRTAGGGGAHT